MVSKFSPLRGLIIEESRTRSGHHLPFRCIASSYLHLRDLHEAFRSSAAFSVTVALRSRPVYGVCISTVSRCIPPWKGIGHQPETGIVSRHVRLANSTIPLNLTTVHCVGVSTKSFSPYPCSKQAFIFQNVQQAT